RNQVAETAIRTIRSQDDPAFIPPLLDTLGRREASFTSGGFAQGLSALAYLARNEEKKDLVREFLIRYVNSPKRNVQVAALSALGSLGDPKALPALQKFALGTKDTPQRSAAERAVTTLRSGRKPVDDFKNLRQEVLDLQKANRDLKKEFEDLKNRLQATPALASPSPAVSKKPTAPKPSPKARGA